MMGIDGDKQHQFMFLNLDDLVPENHFLRVVRNKIDFSFIYEKVQHLYSPVGRRSVDPVLLMKMILIGYLYGIPSERKLEQEVQVNLAYRWFLGLDLADTVPDHSTLSQNRRRRFKESHIFQEIFDHIVSECIRTGLVTGEIIVVDSTHVKANASINRSEKVLVEKKPTEYLEELEKEARRIENDRDNDPTRKKRGRKPKTSPPEKEVQQSTTDPESGLLNRPNKPKGFHYLAHTSVDVKHGIITDIHVTAANVNDHEPFIKRLQAQKEKFGLHIGKVGADKGYDRSGVHHELENLKIIGYISPIKGGIDQTERSVRFTFNEKNDAYYCSNDKALQFTHVKWHSWQQSYSKIYAAKTKDCKSCELRQQCFGQTASRKTIERPLFQEAKERNQARKQSEEYNVIQRQRRIWCEGTFGTMKRQHNLKETYKRGIRNVSEHCLFSAMAINIKRMIKAN